LIESLVEVRIKLLPSGIEGFDVVFEEGLKEEAVSHFNSSVEVVEILSGALRERFW